MFRAGAQTNRKAARVNVVSRVRILQEYQQGLAYRPQIRCLSLTEEAP